MAEEIAEEGHNQLSSDERAKIMQETASSMRSIKAQRSALNEQAGEIRKRLRDANIDVKSWEAALRLSDLEDEARNVYRAGLMEAFSALGIGEQSEMFPDSAAA